MNLLNAVYLKYLQNTHLGLDKYFNVLGSQDTLKQNYILLSSREIPNLKSNDEKNLTYAESNNIIYIKFNDKNQTSFYR